MLGFGIYILQRVIGPCLDPLGLRNINRARPYNLLASFNRPISIGGLFYK